MSPAEVAQRVSEMNAQLDRIERAFDEAEDLIDRLWDAEVALPYGQTAGRSAAAAGAARSRKTSLD